MINFTDLASEKEPWRYRTDILKNGQIGKEFSISFLEMNFSNEFHQFSYQYSNS